jgi:hypothetical protein
MLYAIGETLESLTLLDDLDPPLKEPTSDYQDYAEEIALGDTGTRGVGFPVARWSFALMNSLEEREALRDFCAGKSAPVYISTRKNDGTYADFECVMHWPLREQRFTDEEPMDLVIEFTRLVEIVGS